MIQDMRNFIKSPADINKIEYWLATTVFVFSIFFLVSSSVSNRFSNNQYAFEQAHQQYSYFANYFLPTLVKQVSLYSVYCLLTFLIVPPLIRKENIVLNTIVILIVFGGLTLTLGICDTWTRGHLFSAMSEQEVYNQIFEENSIYAAWLLLMFTLYTCIKIFAIYLLENTDIIQSRYRIISRDAIYAFIIWMIGIFILLVTDLEHAIIIMLGSVSLVAIGIYCYSLYYLIPETSRKPKPFRAYFLKVFIIVSVGSLPMAFFLYLIMPGHRDEFSVITTMLSFCFQLLITAPVSWYVYKQRMTVDYEIKGLQTALGRSTADLNFLRSQINPHFLFNVLNTLYGTALQENAERSAEGIQKLGDMMRFMLRENMQEKISLTREIEYLNNYIDLQKLRTQSSPSIAISTMIDDHIGGLQIAPMLLIPFIENAFKHGISLKEESFIRISLVTKGNSLYFDISNSIQQKVVNDPERDNNGIGLSNVKQRLKLLYNNSHELSIRENGKEFFVHLTLQLH